MLTQQLRGLTDFIGELYAALFAAPDPKRFASAEVSKPWGHKPKSHHTAPEQPTDVRNVPNTNVVVKDVVTENEAGEKVIETVVVATGEEGRVRHLTDADRLALDGLDQTKAAILKPYFATGKSARDTARLINKAGFRERTLDKYWAAFNKAAAETIGETQTPLPYLAEW